MHNVCKVLSTGPGKAVLSFLPEFLHQLLNRLIGFTPTSTLAPHDSVKN